MADRPFKPSPAQLLEALTKLSPGSGDALESLWAEVLEPMCLMYFPPERGDNAEDQLYAATVVLREYVADLIEFTPEVLRSAWLTARRAHRGRTWPDPGTIRACCLDELPKGLTKTLAKPPGPVSYRLLAENWLRSPDGVAALADGLAPDGYRYVERVGEFPPRNELAKWRVSRARVRGWMEHPETCPVSAGSMALLKSFYDNMQRRNAELLRRAEAVA